MVSTCNTILKLKSGGSTILLLPSKVNLSFLIMHQGGHQSDIYCFCIKILLRTCHDAHLPTFFCKQRKSYKSHKQRQAEIGKKSSKC